MQEADTSEYEVDYILEERTRGKKKEYLVKWKHFPDTYNTWEPAENLQSAPNLLAQYASRIRRENRYKKIQTTREGGVPPPVKKPDAMAANSARGVQRIPKPSRRVKTQLEKGDVTDYRCHVCLRYFRAPQGLARHVKTCGLKKSAAASKAEAKLLRDKRRLEGSEPNPRRSPNLDDRRREREAVEILLGVEDRKHSENWRSKKRKARTDSAEESVECPACLGKHRAHICARRKTPLLHLYGDTPMARKQGAPLPPLAQAAWDELRKKARQEAKKKNTGLLAEPQPAASEADTDNEMEKKTMEFDSRKESETDEAMRELWDQQIYPVEKLLDKRRTKMGKTEYLVKWLNQAEEEKSWEPAENILSPKLIQDYNNSHPTEEEGEIIPSKRGGRVKRRYSACADCGSRHSGWGTNRWVGMEKYGRPLCVRCYDRYRKAEQQAKIRSGLVSARVVKRKKTTRKTKIDIPQDSHSDYGSLDEQGASLDPTFPLSPSSMDSDETSQEVEDSMEAEPNVRTSARLGAAPHLKSRYKSRKKVLKTVYIRDRQNKLYELPTKAAIRAKSSLHTTAEKALQTLIRSYESELSSAKVEIDHWRAEYLKMKKDRDRMKAQLENLRLNGLSPVALKFLKGIVAFAPRGVEIQDLMEDGNNLQKRSNKAYVVEAGTSVYFCLPKAISGSNAIVRVRTVADTASFRPDSQAKQDSPLKLTLFILPCERYDGESYETVTGDTHSKGWLSVGSLAEKTEAPKAAVPEKQNATDSPKPKSVESKKDSNDVETKTGREQNKSESKKETESEPNEEVAVPKMVIESASTKGMECESEMKTEDSQQPLESCAKNESSKTENDASESNKESAIPVQELQSPQKDTQEWKLHFVPSEGEELPQFRWAKLTLEKATDVDPARSENVGLLGVSFGLLEANEDLGDSEISMEDGDSKECTTALLHDMGVLDEIGNILYVPGDKKAPVREAAAKGMLSSRTLQPGQGIVLIPPTGDDFFSIPCQRAKVLSGMINAVTIEFTVRTGTPLATEKENSVQNGNSNAKGAETSGAASTEKQDIDQVTGDSKHAVEAPASKAPASKEPGKETHKTTLGFKIEISSYGGSWEEIRTQPLGSQMCDLKSIKHWREVGHSKQDIEIKSSATHVMRARVELNRKWKLTNGPLIDLVRIRTEGEASVMLRDISIELLRDQLADREACEEPSSIGDDLNLFPPLSPVEEKVAAMSMEEEEKNENGKGTTADNAAKRKKLASEPGLIQVVYPVGNETFTPGSSFHVRWLYRGNVGPYVSLKLYRIFTSADGFEDEEVAGTIGTYVKINRGQYRVSLPKSKRRNEKYRLEIASLDSPVVFGYSRVITVKSA